MAIVKETFGFIHAQVHRGKMFHVSSVNMAVVDGASAGLVIKPHAASCLHATFAVAVGGNSRVRLYEEPVVSSCTLLTAQNMNRELSSTVVGASFGYSPAFTSGSVLFDDGVPGGSKTFAVGAGVRKDTEWILEEGETYILAACNLSGGAALISISAECYELS